MFREYPAVTPRWTIGLTRGLPGATHIDSVGPQNVDTSQSGRVGVLISPNHGLGAFISSEKLIMALNGDCFELRGHGALTTPLH